jgi:hypothetical protein
MHTGGFCMLQDAALLSQMYDAPSGSAHIAFLNLRKPHYAAGVQFLCE